MCVVLKEMYKRVLKEEVGGTFKSCDTSLENMPMQFSLALCTHVVILQCLFLICSFIQ